MVSKILLTVVALCVLAFGIAFFSARYLVSKLDGTGGVTAPQEQQYASEEGVSFNYPAKYELSSQRGGNEEREWDVLVLLPKGYVPPQGGEGPPAITLSIFQNMENLPLETWVKGDARSNFKLSSDQKLTTTTVGGKPALSYTHSGLYESDAVAIAHNGKIFLFATGWMTPQDAIRTDFKNLLNTVQFTQ